MKRLTTLLFSVCLAASLITHGNATNINHQTIADSSAAALYSAGLFKGTGTAADGSPIFALDKIPTRNQGLIMFIRLLGKEEEALSDAWDIPFTDVSDFMRPYVGYGYAHGLTAGTTATTFSGKEILSANQYCAFILRALGYTSDQDFTVRNASEFGSSIGLVWEEFRSGPESFTRGDLAIISYSALRFKAPILSFTKFMRIF